MPLCFAYGSNMDRDAMASRCPASKPLGPAVLKRHRLAIMREGYLTVVRDPRRDVHGLLWEVALADMRALDRYEDVPSGLYAKVQQPVLTSAGPRNALVYVGRNAGPGVPLPGYVESVLAAGRAAGLPERHLRQIAALAPGAGRSGPAGTGEGRAGPVPGVTARRVSPLEREPDRNRGSWDR